VQIGNWLPAQRSVAPIPTRAANAPSTTDLLVVGAGVMGAWTAYWARAGGAGPDGRWGGGRSVTLLDAWGAGHLRATSSDEHRIIRSAHGDDPFYARWSRRALAHWRRFEEEWSVPLFEPSGVLWFATSAAGWEADSERTLGELGIPTERLAPEEIARRWPGIDPAGLAFGLHEPEAGFLWARRGVQAAVAAFQRAGGTYALAGVRPGREAGGRLLDVVDQAGRRWSAETFVFAAGPWLPKLFPEVCGSRVAVTRQPVFYIGPGEGDGRFRADAMPGWSDDAGGCYGIPAADDRGFKIGIDRVGPRFDPSNGERLPDPDDLRLARAFLARRFPDLAARPLLEARVCQYESTPDRHFLVDRHPAWENAWLVGGGSGHGFKHGPRIGEYLVGRLDGLPEGAQDGAGEARFRVGPRAPRRGPHLASDTMAEGWELF
jgi:glycine/D-amino acid oxidase-like deaminating enzyme